MAKEAEIDRTQISVPVGSLEEVLALGALVRNIATCSEHTDRNMGCPMFDDCDREWKGTPGARPRNEAFQVVKKDGTMREGCGVCFANIRIQEQIEANDGYFEIIGQEGDKYCQRGTKTRHPQRDPLCPQCMSKEGCGLVDELDPQVPNTVVPPFPPAEQHPDLVKYLRARRARGAVKEAQREKRKLRLLGPDSKDEVESHADPGSEAAGTQPGGGKGKSR